jgi:acetyl-CoA carboxylase biotin carboxyl carrier protein
MAEKPRPRQPASKPAPVPKKPSRKAPMSDSDPSPPTVFEIERIRRLVELMEEHDLSEVDLRESRQRIRICRGPKDAPPAAATSSAAPPAAPAQSSAPAPLATSQATDGPNIAVIKSPMVGTFYSRPNPKAEVFVKVGDRVDTTTVVCIIEAMKVFNEIPAELRGQVVAVLVGDGEAVDFEKPLFKVDTSK